MTIWKHSLKGDIKGGTVKQREIKLTNIFHGLNRRIGMGESEAIVLAIELEADM